MKAEFVGRVVRRMEVQEFALTQTTYPRGAFIPWHSHDHVYLCLVLAGTFRERHRREHRICGPSSFLYYPPDEPHAESFHGSKALLLNIQLSDRWLGGIRPHLSFDGAPRHIEDGLLTALGIRLLRELHTNDSAAVVAIEGLLLELMAALSRLIRTPKQASPPAWLTRAREVIHERS